MIIYGPPPKVEKNQWVAIDLEMFGLPEGRIHRPKPENFGLATFTIGSDVYMCQTPEEVAIATQNTNDGIWVFHNAMFDLVHLRSIVDVPDRKKIWDTLLIERILYNGYYSTFGLEDLAARYLDISMDKSGQKTWAKTQSRDKITQEMLDYGAEDGLVTVQIAPIQQSKMDRYDYDVWTKLDREAMWAVLAFRGFPVDVEKLTELKDKHLALSNEYDSRLSFNPRSPTQVPEYFKSTYKIKLDSSDEEHLTSLLDELDSKKYKKLSQGEKDKIKEEVSYTLLSRNYRKKASTYGTSLIDSLEYQEGVKVIHGLYNITGAMTGRLSSKDPDMQNIPVRGDGSVFRECFIPYPDEVLIIGDYSSQEPRITAVYSNDPILKEIFEKDFDVYIEMGYMVYGERFDKRDERRKYMKDMFLGMCYGLSKYGVSKKYGWELSEAEKLIAKTFKQFPTAKKYIDKARKNRSFTRTLGGRRFWLNPYSSQVERHSLNAPIQGTASDQMKLALSYVYKNWPVHLCKYGVVASVHDEMVLSVPKDCAEELRVFVEKQMVKAAQDICPGVPFKADVKLAESWAEK